MNFSDCLIYYSIGVIVMMVGYYENLCCNLVSTKSEDDIITNASDSSDSSESSEPAIPRSRRYRESILEL